MAETTTRPATYNVGFTEEELQELIWLIDDEPVDEEFLKGIRKKLLHKRGNVRRRARQNARGGTTGSTGTRDAGPR